MPQGPYYVYLGPGRHRIAIKLTQEFLATFSEAIYFHFAVDSPILCIMMRLSLTPLSEHKFCPEGILIIQRSLLQGSLGDIRTQGDSMSVRTT